MEENDIIFSKFEKGSGKAKREFSVFLSAVHLQKILALGIVAPPKAFQNGKL